jgi:hypothetical protein
MMLPEWEVRVSKKVIPDWLWITCPRCSERTIVAPDWGKGGYPTRPCTYCFAANKIPGRDQVEPKT